MQHEILAEFLEFLWARSPKLAQVEIANRAGISQSLVNKLLRHSGKPELRTYQQLAAAFPAEWKKYLATHPDLHAQLLQEYAWIGAGVHDRQPTSQLLSEALRILARLDHAPQNLQALAL